MPCPQEHHTCCVLKHVQVYKWTPHLLQGFLSWCLEGKKMLVLVTHSNPSYRSCKSDLDLLQQHCSVWRAVGTVSVWEKMGWAGGRNGKVPNMVNAPGLSAGKIRACREGNRFQGNKPAVWLCWASIAFCLGAVPVYSVNEVTLTDSIYFTKKK